MIHYVRNARARYSEANEARRKEQEHKATLFKRKKETTLQLKAKQVKIQQQAQRLKDVIDEEISALKILQKNLTYLNDISTLESSDEGGRNVLNSPYKLNEEIETNSYFDFESESDEVNLTSTSIFNSSVSSVTHTSQEESLSHKLRIGAVEHEVTLTSLNSLLNVLHDYHPELPLDRRTLLKTSRKSEIVKFSSEEFCYYGIAKYLPNADLRVICSDHHIRLRINIDGLPLCRSSGTQF
ncbi:hypothetical protein AVEN_23036-1 [Araneus ventricosus]|uniref:Uncharacterized protein n=1 Tax=Araneus ventricosus TaxID=182803 RepID=A0A4Y2LKU7_ARAVE|nr:hypothetical protein AVEN_23036-1 [Araneus ventricosus]